MSQFAHSLFLVHVALLFGAPVVSAQAIASTRSDVTRIREFNRPTKTVKEWRAQVEAAIIQVTGVKVEVRSEPQGDRTESGLDITLETADGKPLAIDASKFRTEGNNLIADIPNAVLVLPDGQPFAATNPAKDVTNITVTQLDPTSIRISVLGDKAPPKTEVVLKVGELAYTLNQDDADDEEIVVTGEGQRGYRVPNASTATRTDTPIRDVPASIQVIPREVIRDQNATSIRETVRNVSGVTYASSSGNRSERFIVRGFSANNFLNGFRNDFFSSRTQEDLANIDRIEVLKGPASILFGQVDPSGIINRVTKKPLFEPFYELSFTAGSYDFYRPALDFGGPLTEDKTLAYRLNIAYENAGSFRDRVQTERFLFAPSFTHRLGDNTSLNLEVSYLRDARPVDRGLVVLSNNKVPNIPIGRYLGDPTKQEKFTQTLASLTLNHQFNSNLSLRSLFRYTASTETGPGATLQIDGDTEDDRTFPLSDFIGDQYYETYYWQNDFVAKFNTGSIQHTALVGFELSRQNSFFSGAGRSAGFIDVFNPSYDFTFGEFEAFDPFDDVTKTFGIYVQDQITLLDNLKLLVGGRFDTYRYKFTSADVAGTPDQAEAFTPRVGVVYQPIKEVSLYASYSQSFTPNGGRSVSNQPFDPQRGTGYEVGVKTDFLNGRLSSTLAFYNTTLKNILTEDVNNPGFSVQVGEQRSRGIEFDIAGELLPGWKLIASYAHTDAQITKDNSLTVGNRLNNVPRNSASLWTTYTLQNGDLKGLGIGAGAFYVGDRAGDLANSFEVPSYTRLDAAVFYQRDRFRVALNFKNLANTRYFEGSQDRTQVIPGTPFTVLGTISYQF
ncbi:TonB-dependent siderophore receptor [Leptolyngbyaceae cyanobacterium UHCC 1019]